MNCRTAVYSGSAQNAKVGHCFHHWTHRLAFFFNNNFHVFQTKRISYLNSPEFVEDLSPRQKGMSLRTGANPEDVISWFVCRRTNFGACSGDGFLLFQVILHSSGLQFVGVILREQRVDGYGHAVDTDTSRQTAALKAGKINVKSHIGDMLGRLLSCNFLLTVRVWLFTPRLSCIL